MYPPAHSLGDFLGLYKRQVLWGCSVAWQNLLMNPLEKLLVYVLHI